MYEEVDKMLIDFRIRKCLNIQYGDVQLGSYLSIFLNNRDVLLCVFKEKQFYSCIDYSEIEKISSNDELYDYMENEAVHGWVNSLDMRKIQQILSTHKHIMTILLEKPDFNKETILTISREPIVLRSGYVDFSLYAKLKQKNIASFVVNFPDNIKNVYGTFTNINFSELFLKEPSLKKMFEIDVKRITDLQYNEFILKVLEKNESYRREDGLQGDRTLFLVGPCIVAGPYNSELSLPEMLDSLLREAGFSYKIITIDSRYFSNQLLEYDICQNDIIIFLGYGLHYYDLDLTDVYENYHGVKNLCTNLSMHVSGEGCKLVADAIMKNIMIPQCKISNTQNNKQVLHYAEKNQIPYEVEYEIKLFLKRTQIAWDIRRGKNGAIVMNANPFTLGHRKLVEYASEQVDNLYIFVVEEDASYFLFRERFDMVQQGTADIKNVIVLASGNFIISKKTFYGYFTKENDTGQVIDASLDIYIFARYIAPYFHIKKRFVGSEPIDVVTRQYNEQMKRILPDYGCELIEISRFQKNNIIVSGSMVREALFNSDIYSLQRLLPSTSFDYIIKRKKKVKNENIDYQGSRNLGLCMTDRFLKIFELFSFIKEKKRVVIYGVGNDTRIFMRLFEESEKKELIFVDKRAKTSELLFMGKKVFSPEVLKDGYLEYQIVILSQKYYKEIFFECIDMGINKDRIRYNPYDLYLWVKTE